MRESEFLEQIRRLKDVFGERAYTDERCKVLWKNFQRIPDGVFTQATDEFIANSRQAPLVSELTEAVNRIASQRRTTASTVIRTHCLNCGGEGYVQLQDENGRDAVGACERCEPGRLLAAKERGAFAKESLVRAHGYTRKRFFSTGDFTASEKMPETVRALCTMIKENRADSGAFRFGCKFSGLTENEAWEIYTAFIEKRPDSEPARSILRRVRERKSGGAAKTLAQEIAEEEDVA